MYMHRFSKRRKDIRGFTLVELLVVIAIIGILASIILASLGSAKAQARDARRISDIKEIQLALELYYDANNVFPNKISVANLVTPGYISVVPSDPSSNTGCVLGTEAGCYHYAAFGSGFQCVSYHLGTSLEQNTNTAINTAALVAAVGSGLCTSSQGDFSGSKTVNCVAGDTWGGGDCYDAHS